MHTTRTQIVQKDQRRTYKRPQQRVTVWELREMMPNVSKTFIDKMLTDNLGHAKVYTSGEDKTRGFKLTSQRGGRILRLRYKEDSISHSKMHQSQQRLCRKLGKNLSFPKM